MSEIQGKNITQNGLVLHLDSGNPQSFDGNSTIWRDLSGNGNNGTLVNGVSYSGNNRGVLSFDGTNDYMVTSTVTFKSINMWIKFSGGPYLLDARPSSPNGYFWLGGAGSDWVELYVNGISTTVPRSNFGGIQNNTWVNIHLVNNSTYTGIITFLSRYTTFEYGSGQIPIVQVYNRALSQQEITQNYNATKSRFGL